MGSPMKVFLQPRLASENKITLPDSPRSTASGEGFSSSESCLDCPVMSFGSSVGLTVDNDANESHSEWHWDSPTLNSTNYDFLCDGQYVDPQLMTMFDPFDAAAVFPLSDTAGGFSPYPFMQGISIEEMYLQQQSQQDFNSVANLASAMPVTLPLVGVAPDVSCEADFQNGFYSEFPSAGSAAHFEGWCKPCAFAYEGCANGNTCAFCHLCGPGELKARKRAKLAQRRKMNRIAQQPPRWTNR